MREPRHPSLKVVWHSVSPRRRARSRSKANTNEPTLAAQIGLSLAMEADSKGLWFVVYDELPVSGSSPPPRTYNRVSTSKVHRVHFWYGCFRVMNDPTAGSPTVTLLRLHLPLNDEVWANSHGRAPMKVLSHDPETSPNHSIGRCDGRCVQRAGT